jgi:hypothetical protein
MDIPTRFIEITVLFDGAFKYEYSAIVEVTLGLTLIHFV